MNRLTKSFFLALTALLTIVLAVVTALMVLFVLGSMFLDYPLSFILIALFLSLWLIHYNALPKI
jgi:hypothetical protein